MIFNGVSRNVDDLGRIVVPKEIRRILDWKDKELLDIKLFGKYVLICAHEDNDSLTVTADCENPICHDIISCLKKLSADDLLCIYQVIKRLEC